MTNKNRVYSSTMFVVLVLVAISQAQTRINTATGLNNTSRLGVTGGQEFRLDSFSLRRASKRALLPIGFRLEPEASAKINSALMTPMGLNLQVLGSDTIGRLTKWAGLTSSNSFIGDSTIFDDKFGSIGLGTDPATSRLTVAGTIQSLSGGFKFPDGTVQTTSAGGPLFGVAHDSTLRGDGTSGSPLGVEVPLILNGSVGSPGGIIQATNTSASGKGVVASGGPEGHGVNAAGGDSTGGLGGVGVVAGGGNSGRGQGGAGVAATAGDSGSGQGGAGVFAAGGSSDGGFGGAGLEGFGGFSGNGLGGDGVFVNGGGASGMGSSGGSGIVAFGGFAINGATNGLAGNFFGDVAITGNLSKGGGSFKIDHPLDPENKYLYHSFVESPDMKNIYDGDIVTDENGEAVVTLPAYFEALNRDFRYQLTVIGTFAQAIVAGRIKNNHFTIKTNAPNVEVSWQVTGIRQDPYANKHRIPIEEEKGERERGYYLHPDAFNQSDEKGVEWARNPEIMRRMEETRLKQIEESKKKLLKQ